MMRLLAFGLLAAGACENRSAAIKSAVPSASAAASPPSRERPADDDPHPLKSWMTANMARPIKTGSFDELARALALVAKIDAPGLTDWAPIARRGRQAAFARDIDAVRASCADCHDRYRDAYRRTMRDRPLVFER
jgi:hypothetical protein